jgi:hypothetical protein
MGKGRAKSFKPAGKDKSKFSSAAASKKARQQRKTTGGIIRGRVETPKTERKVPPVSSTGTNILESQTDGIGAITARLTQTNGSN